MSLDVDPPAVAPDDERRVASSRATPLHLNQIAEVFDRCYGRLLKSLVAHGATRSEAEEIVGRAFEQVLSMKDPGSVSSLDRYLFRATRNLAVNLFKHRAMRQRNDVLLNSGSISTSPSAEAVWMERQRYDVLRRAIQELPSKCQMTMRLRIWDGLSYPEIVARFATLGIEITERTLRRYVQIGLERCRLEILASEERRQREHR